MAAYWIGELVRILEVCRLLNENPLLLGVDEKRNGAMVEEPLLMRLAPR